MATYCFSERQRELFREACLRGWLAAVIDFPRFKNDVEREAAALAASDALCSEVCCIPDDFAYRRLAASAWCCAYLALGRDSTERDIAIQVSKLKPMSSNEALAYLRLCFSEVGGWAAIDAAYARFQAAILV